MAIKNSWSSGEVLTAADLTDTMKGVFINAQTSTSYTFGTADGFVTLSNASGGTATIPANSTAAFNTGAVIGVMNAGTAGSFTIGTAAGVTLNAVSGTTKLAPLEKAELIKLGTNTWQLYKASPGKVLQVVRATDTTQRSTTSTSYVDVTGMSVTITPQKSDSTVLVIAVFYAIAEGTVSNRGKFQITDSSNNAISGAEAVEFGTNSNSLKSYDGLNLVAYATPATTSAVTYKLRFLAEVASTTMTVQNAATTGQLYAIEVSA